MDVIVLRQQGPAAVRAGLGDGNFAGRYQRSDAEMLAIWQVAVEETRAVIADAWKHPASLAAPGGVSDATSTSSSRRIHMRQRLACMVEV